MINKNREIKEAKVLEIREKLEKAQGVVLAKYQGLSVEEDTELRKKLREAGIEYKVYKNTLTTYQVSFLLISLLKIYLTLFRLISSIVLTIVPPLLITSIL